jgi:hypothetical protein
MASNKNIPGFAEKLLDDNKIYEYFNSCFP